MVKNSLFKNVEFWNKNEILGTFVHGYQFWAGQQSLGTKGLNHENNSKALTKAFQALHLPQGSEAKHICKFAVRECQRLYAH